MPHRKDLVADFTDDQRRRLAALIGRFLTDARVAEHLLVAAGSDVLHPSHEQFFVNHRAYIAKLETFLMASGGQEFVPLPKWNDQDDIPSQFWHVRPRDDGTPRAYLNDAYNHLPPPAHPLPASVQGTRLCAFADAEAVTHELSDWHGEVHGRLGGVMLLNTPAGPDPATEAAAALIFWPWHAFNDEIYHAWERCKLRDSGALAVGRNDDGRLEVFAQGRAGELWHCWQQPTYGGWSTWWNMGGSVKQVVAASNADGRMEVFVIGADDALHHRWQTAPNNGWSAWNSRAGWHQQIAVARNFDGRLEVFAIGGGGALWHVFQTTPGGPWGGWVSEGGISSQIVVGQNKDGRLEVFAIGSDLSVYQIWQTSPGGGWSGWRSMGRPGGQPAGRIAVGRNQDERQEVFAADVDGRVWHIRQTAASNGWSGWTLAGQQPSPTAPVAQIAAEHDDAGRLNVFVLRTSGALFHARQTAANTAESWSAWTRMDAARLFARMCVGRHKNGRLEVFAVVRGDVIWHTWQNPANPDTWERWQLL